MSDKQNLDLSETSVKDRLVGFVISYLLRFNIAKKIMFGYTVLLALLVIISVYALVKLNQLNEINNSILNTDLPVISASQKMIDVILDQELHAQRYLILGTSELLKLFWDKNEEFNYLINHLKTLQGKWNIPIDELVKLHKQYNYILTEGLSQIDDPESSTAKDFETKIKKQQEKIIAAIKGMAANAMQDQNEKTGMTATMGRTAFKASAILCGLGLVFSLSAAILITQNISGPIKKLKHAAGLISEGNFDHKPDIRNKDELGDLAQAFSTMAHRLKCLEEMYLDASPLTRLPGGIAVENVVNKLIITNASIAFCLMDIDNFKAYNDRYGYAKGNDLIQSTASIISEAVEKFGGEDDFIGHIGGDDFILITTPDFYIRICESVVENFDKIISDFYDTKDRQRGCIIAENRQGQEVSVPLASISIAVVTNDKRKFLNHIQVGEAVSEMKELAKSVAGSVCLVDQRGNDKGTSNKDRKLISIQNSTKGLTD